MGQTLYELHEDGGIVFKSGRRPWMVDIPIYVFDIWEPLIGSDALGVYVTYCRLERQGDVRGLSLKTLATRMRKGVDSLNNINGILERYGFIKVEKPKGWQKLAHYTTSFTVLDPPTEVTPEIIDELWPRDKDGNKSESWTYEPLCPWLVDVEQIVRKTQTGFSETPEQVFRDTPNGYAKIESSYIEPSSKSYARRSQERPAPAGKGMAFKTQREGVRETDRDAGEKVKISFTDSEMPLIGQYVAQVLKQGGVDPKSLTRRQVELLQSQVMVEGVGWMPSPESEMEAYPAAWQTFCNNLLKMPAVVRRTENKAPTPGLIIDAMRGYHWLKGWLHYRPGGKPENAVVEQETQHIPALPDWMQDIGDERQL